MLAAMADRRNRPRASHRVGKKDTTTGSVSRTSGRNVVTGRGELVFGAASLVGAAAIAMAQSGSEPTATATIAAVLVLAGAGGVGLAFAGYHLDRRPDQPVHRDPRRTIYCVLLLAFALLAALAVSIAMPNRLASGMLHTAMIPLFMALAGVGLVVGGRRGWWLSVSGASLVLLATILLIARILASAAYLAGVYGAFGKAAATFSIVMVALIVEFVALLPICHIRFLMSQRGRRAHGL